MDALSNEIVRAIFSFIPPTELVAHSKVSKRFAEILKSKRLWQLLYNEDLSKTDFLSKEQIQRVLIYEHCLQANEGEEGVALPSCLDEGTLLADRQTAERIKKIGSRRACVASTTDHTTESLENILPSIVRELSRPRSRSYWSSAAAPTQDSNDTLLFATRYPLSVVKNVTIRPLKEPDQHRIPRRVYTWQKTIIRAYRVSLDTLVGDWPAHFPCMFQRIGPEEMQDAEFVREFGFPFERKAQADRATIEYITGLQEPVYKSDEWEVPSDECEDLTYHLPPGVIANVVVVDLIGKNYEQETGNGFYACVKRINCIGIPLPASP